MNHFIKFILIATIFIGIGENRPLRAMYERVIFLNRIKDALPEPNPVYLAKTEKGNGPTNSIASNNLTQQDILRPSLRDYSNDIKKAAVNDNANEEMSLHRYSNAVKQAIAASDNNPKGEKSLHQYSNEVKKAVGALNEQKETKNLSHYSDALKKAVTTTIPKGDKKLPTHLLTNVHVHTFTDIDTNRNASHVLNRISLFKMAGSNHFA